MKKRISILSLVLIISIITISVRSANNAIDNNSTQTEAKNDNQVSVLYFHATKRCVTCKAVEKVTIDAIKEYYGDKVSFKLLNREKDVNKELIEKYEIGGQTLLIVKGDKKVDLTTFAFMNAKTFPAKLKKKIKSTVDSMM